MADVSTQYVLTTGGPTITFNDGVYGDGTDKFWLNSVQGLDGPVIRAPVDVVPFGDGGLIHTFWKGPRRIVLDGMLLIESSLNQVDCQLLRNALIADLSSALDSMLSPSSGTLTWTPAGQAMETISVFCEIGLNTPYSDNFMVQNFSFGLVSAESDPT